MNENVKNLLELVKENPDLPIVPMVDGEIVAGDDFATWMGTWGGAWVDYYIIDPNGMVLYRSHYDVIDVLERCLSEDEFDALPDDEIDNIRTFDARPWTKAIIVNITT